MKITRTLNTSVCSLLAAFMSLSVVAADVPHVFVSGTPAYASQVNENFDALESAIDSKPEVFQMDLTEHGTWENYGGAYETASYYKEANGMVHLQGLIKSANFSTLVFVLPEGYRPAGRRAFSVVAGVGYGAFGRCDISANGNVEFVVGDGAYMSLDGISFLAE